MIVKFKYSKKIALLDIQAERHIDFVLYKNLASFKRNNESIAVDIAEGVHSTLTVNVTSGSNHIDCAIILLRIVEDVVEYEDVKFSNPDFGNIATFTTKPGNDYRIYYVARGQGVDGFYIDNISGDNDETIDLGLSLDDAGVWFNYSDNYTNTELNWTTEDLIPTPVYSYDVTVTDGANSSPSPYIQDVLLNSISAEDSVIQVMNSQPLQTGDRIKLGSELGDEVVFILETLDPGEMMAREYAIWRPSNSSDPKDRFTPIIYVPGRADNIQSKALYNFEQGSTYSATVAGESWTETNYPYIRNHNHFSENNSHEWDGYLYLEDGQYDFAILSDDTSDWKIFDVGDTGYTNELLHLEITNDGGINALDPSNFVDAVNRMNDREGTIRRYAVNVPITGMYPYTTELHQSEGHIGLYLLYRKHGTTDWTHIPRDCFCKKDNTIHDFYPKPDTGLDYSTFHYEFNRIGPLFRGLYTNIDVMYTYSNALSADYNPAIATGDYLKIDDEIVKVLNQSSTSYGSYVYARFFHLERGVHGTTIAPHTTGTDVYKTSWTIE
jgi:hypothetical protein